MEMKDLVTQTHKAFEDLKSALSTQTAEVKELGSARTETKAAVDAIVGRLEALEAQIAESARKSAKAHVPMVKDADREPTPADRAFSKFLRYGAIKGFDRFDAEEKAAWQELRTKSLSEGNDAKGGIVVPEDFQLQVIQKIPNFAQIAGLVTRQTTSRDVLKWPSIPYSTDDISTSGVAITWEDEVDSATETDFTMASVAVQVKKVRALIKVSNDLIEDQAVDVIALLSSLLAEAFGVEEDKVLTNGSGPRKPEGFMTNTDIASVNSGAATDVTYAGLVDFVYALPEQYAQNGLIMLKRGSVANVRKLVGSDGHPIWQPSFGAGQPATILGYPFKTNEHMPAIAAAAKAAIFADFRRLMVLAERTGMTIKRLDEKYAETDETGFIARRRFGAKVVAPWAAKKLNISA